MIGLETVNEFLEKILIGMVILFIVAAPIIGVVIFLGELNETINSQPEEPEVLRENPGLFLNYKWKDNINGGIMYLYEDSITGVQYIYISHGYDGGITPRYNADGTLFVSGEVG